MFNILDLKYSAIVNQACMEFPMGHISVLDGKVQKLIQGLVSTKGEASKNTQN